jgi:hypothetical protein
MEEALPVLKKFDLKLNILVLNQKSIKNDKKIIYYLTIGIKKSVRLQKIMKIFSNSNINKRQISQVYTLKVFKDS